MNSFEKFSSWLQHILNLELFNLQDTVFENVPF